MSYTLVSCIQKDLRTCLYGEFSGSPSFTTDLLSAFCMPSTGLGAADGAVNKTGFLPTARRVLISKPEVLKLFCLRTLYSKKFRIPKSFCMCN